MTGKEKLLEAIKPWLCCSRPRHNNNKYHDLEKSGNSSGLNISAPIAIEVNGKPGGDFGGPMLSVEELPTGQPPKRLDGNFDPKFPPASLGSYAPDNEKRRTFDFFQYTPTAPNRITQIIDSYGDYGEGPNGRKPPVPPVPLKLDDDYLRSEIEFIRAAARKYPDNADLSAAADATYLVDENGEPRPEMIKAIDRVLGGSARERQHMSSSSISDYNSMNLIQPLHPKPARCRDGDQPRQLLRSMDERKQLEQRLLNIQRSLSQRKKDKTDSLLVPSAAHGPQGPHSLQHREVIDELIDDFYDDDCPQVTQESLPKPPPPSAQPRRAPTLSALNPHRRNTFRNSNPLDDSRFSLNYSEYIYEEYGKPSPTEVMFPTAADDPGLMRSVSQRPAEPPLRRTRSSETIVPQRTLMLSRNDSVASAPGNRIDRWLSKQDEIYGAEDSGPAPITNLPRLPKASRLSKRPESLLRRNSIGTAEDYWPSARDIIPSPGFPPPANSCVGIPYSAMLRKDPATVSVVSANTYHSASSVPPPPSELAQQYISELEGIPTGPGRHSMEDLPSHGHRLTGFEAGKMI
ncbi:uncharacterized protein H6S33_009228 [Morchella sextelata]|uniref:uncharacterized protein n=1 Tax=Morchella sextelata TaxID=1174677 RepID=UPI001D04DE88|nr:uncharacterized protein H6S33_009228 [Morchella sextelata]KAH0612848.1 hypothetical protein H6S33_009228 [Morchella sextelata]